MAKRDPHEVLGVEEGASPTQIKAAWRKLARRHHPDLTGDDPAASRVATRLMAEINDSYAALTRDGGSVRTGRAGRRSAAEAGAAAGASAGPARRSGGPPRPRPTRPVTARLDLSDTMPPRNAPLRAAGASATPLRGQAPYRPTGSDREPPRASTPTGPLERARIRGFRRPAGPPLDAAKDVELEFGKFRGHTLGQVAAFEPSYIDWLAKTITRDRELVAAARVVADDLDRRNVVRREHAHGTPARTGA